MSTHLITFFVASVLQILAPKVPTTSSVTKYELNSITLTLHLTAFYVALTSLLSTEVPFSPAETDGETTASSNSEVMEELVLVLV